jgi:hypothetical protein
MTQNAELIHIKIRLMIEAFFSTDDRNTSRRYFDNIHNEIYEKSILIFDILS